MPAQPPLQPPQDHASAGLHDPLRLHIQARQQRDRLLMRARTLQHAGKLPQAHRLLREAQTIQRWLTALEDSYGQGSRPN